MDEEVQSMTTAEREEYRQRQQIMNVIHNLRRMENEMLDATDPFGEFYLEYQRRVQNTFLRLYSIPKPVDTYLRDLDISRTTRILQDMKADLLHVRSVLEEMEWDDSWEWESGWDDVDETQGDEIKLREMTDTERLVWRFALYSCTLAINVIEKL